MRIYMNYEEDGDCGVSHDLVFFGGGSVGGTPHSGTPLGRSIRFGSHFSSAAALSFYRTH